MSDTLAVLLHEAGIAEWDCDPIAARLAAANVVVLTPEMLAAALQHLNINRGRLEHEFPGPWSHAKEAAAILAALREVTDE